MLRAAVESHEGYVFSPGGDGFGVAFSRAADAVDAAKAAQEALAERSFIRVRMGIHTGESQERDGNYFGPPVNRAARLMAAGHGGQVLVSAATAELVPGLVLKNLGERDLGSPMLVWQLDSGSSSSSTLWCARCRSSASSARPPTCAQLYGHKVDAGAGFVSDDGKKSFIRGEAADA